MATRFQQQQEIEDAIMAFGPEPDEAVDLIHALQASLKRAYGDASIDVQEALSVACDACEELDATLYRRNLEPSLDDLINGLRAAVNR
jgi:hypothetical protein